MIYDARNGIEKAWYWDNLDWQYINQSIEKSLLNIDSLDVLFNKKDTLTGSIEIINSGLIEGEDYNKDWKEKIMNPKEPALKKWFLKVDNRRVFPIKLPNVISLQTGFVSQAAGKEFRDVFIKKITTSAAYYLFKEKFRMILSEKIWKRNYNDDGSFKDETGTSYDIDKTIKAGTFQTDAQIKIGLERIRLALINMETPGTHTKFSTDNKNALFRDNFKPEEFVMVWATKYYVKIGTLSATLFNKDDVLFKGPTQLYFNLEEIEGLDNATKTAQAKTIGYLIHKKALVMLGIQPTQSNVEMITGNFQTLYRMLINWGFGRMKTYPIIKIVAETQTKK